MTVEELINPRYELIADFPGNKLHVGDVIHCPVRFTFDFGKELWIKSHDNYPHLFKKLNWWEKRQESDMPMYLRSDLDKKHPTFHKILKWEMKELWGVIDPIERSVCSLMAFNPEYGYFPATEQEYNSYCIISKKQ